MSNQITQTTLSTSINQNANLLNLASVTNIVAPTNQGMQKLYVINIGTMKGELMTVAGAPNGNYVPVSRLDQERQSFYTGAIVLIAPFVANTPLGGFYTDNPYGASAVTGNLGQSNNTVITPWVNVNTGEQWVVGLNGIWVPAWQNPQAGAVAGMGTLVTAVAGTLPTPTAPFFHVTASGTPAVTGIPFPIGFTGGDINIIPDAAFTWTTGDGSIAVGGTAVVDKILTFTADLSAGKWYPSYVS